MTVSVRYVGPHDAVDIPTIGLTVGRDVPVEVDDGAAVALCASADFEPAAKKDAKAIETLVASLAPVPEPDAPDPEPADPEPTIEEN